MKIPFVDLHAQYLSIKEEIDSAIAEVIAESAYIRERPDSQSDLTQESTSSYYDFIVTRAEFYRNCESNCSHRWPGRGRQASARDHEEQVSDVRRRYQPACTRLPV